MALREQRAALFQRLRALRAAGLPALECQSLLRIRTCSDFVFVARACGIPQQDADSLDTQLLLEAKHLLGLQVGESGHSTDKRFFLEGRHGGLGFQNVSLASPAAHTASWHCCLPTILKKVRIPSTSGLMAMSPWAARTIPECTRILRDATGEVTNELGDTDVHALQRCLANVPYAAVRSPLITELASVPCSAALLHRAGGPGAFTWMLPLTDVGHHLADA